MRLSHFLVGASAAALALPALAQTAVPTTAQAPAAAPTETLREAMVKAYRTNPEITGERANLRASDENVPIARAAGLPGVNSNAGYQENLYDSDGSGVGSPRTGTVGVDLSLADLLAYAGLGDWAQQVGGLLTLKVSSLAATIPFALMLVVLLVRPSGLMGEKE